MKVSDFNLREMLAFKPEEGQLLLGRDRMLLFRQEAFARLRKLLFEQLGETLSKALLSQFGYQCGEGDYHALNRFFTWDTEADRLAIGPVMHTWEGIVLVELEKFEYDRVSGHFLGRGTWKKSYEAEIHIEQFGIGDAPVCHSLTGYASGWCSTFFGAPVLAVEKLCMGKGDPHCLWEIRPENMWGSEAAPWREALQSNKASIARELEEKLALIEEQQSALAKLSTPIIKVWEDVLTLPIVGTVTASRAAAMKEELLHAIARTKSRFAILDMTGVDVVDTVTADHFMRIVRSVKLLGAHCMISGIRPAVAQTMTGLGVDMSQIDTCSTLEDALKLCMRRLEAEKAQKRHAPAAK
ncbi:MAG: XylR N-terminal domain-containing protein [Polyangiaceae bacterium]|nr:XylR N-terminal domain-containing protein [Polyangiaceae bacterium]